MTDPAQVEKDFAALMRERDHLLGSLPAELKRRVLEATLEANAQILTHARTDRDRALERLESARQKGAVTSYYQSNGGALSE